MEPLRSGLGFQKRRKRLLLSQGSANPVLPTQIGSVAAWYRYGQGITQAGGFASAWADQSGFGRNLLQASGAAQPAVNPDGSLLFNGTSHFMRATFTLNQPFTFCALVKQVSFTATDYIMGGSTATNAVRQQTAPPQIQMFGTSGTPTNSALNVGVYGALITVWNGASSVLRINNAAEVTGNVGTTNPGGIVLAANAAGTNLFGNVEFKEVIAFSIALNTTQRQLMVIYLASVGNLVI